MHIATNAAEIVSHLWRDHYGRSNNVKPHLHL